MSRKKKASIARWSNRQLEVEQQVFASQQANYQLSSRQISERWLERKKKKRKRKNIWMKKSSKRISRKVSRNVIKKQQVIQIKKHELRGKKGLNSYNRNSHRSSNRWHCSLVGGIFVCLCFQDQSSPSLILLKERCWQQQVQRQQVAISTTSVLLKQEGREEEGEEEEKEGKQVYLSTRSLTHISK